jgi:hypothetical protein
LLGNLVEDTVTLSFGGIPLAIGFAVLKYRLYYIELIINRALVYGSLTVRLATVYLGGRNGDPGSLPNVYRPRGASPVRRRGFYPCDRRSVQPCETTHSVVHR